MIPYFSFNTFEILGITFHTWGLLVGLGFAAGAWYSLREARAKGFDENKVLNLILVIFIASFIGARFFYALQFGWDYFQGGYIFNVWDGGLMFYGGMIGAIIGGVVYLLFSLPIDLDSSRLGEVSPSIKSKMGQITKVVDFLTPGIALGLVIGRIGCALINDHAGALTTVPWAIQFPDATLRHPVIIYLLLSNILLFIAIFFTKSRLTYPGALFTLFIIWYTVARLFLDFFRASDVASFNDPRIFNLTTSQIISIGILFLAAIGLYAIPGKFNKRNLNKIVN